MGADSTCGESTASSEPQESLLPPCLLEDLVKVTHSQKPCFCLCHRFLTLDFFGLVKRKLLKKKKKKKKERKGKKERKKKKKKKDVSGILTVSAVIT